MTDNTVTPARRPILTLKRKAPAEAAAPPLPPPEPPPVLAHAAPQRFDIADTLQVLAPLFQLAEGERLLTVYPYALGIFDLLVTDPRYVGGSDGRRRVRRVLARVTHSHAYVSALARPGAMRHGIDGTPVEPVSAEHRAHAVARLEEKRNATRPAR